MSGAIKHDDGKLRFLIPVEVEDQIAEIYDLGAKKYGIGNYQQGDGFEPGRWLSAMRRHVSAWRRGEMNDPEDRKAPPGPRRRLADDADGAGPGKPHTTEQEWRDE